MPSWRCSSSNQAAPYAELEPAARRVVDRDRLGREHRRVAVRHAGDEQAEPHALGDAAPAPRAWCCPRSTRPGLRRTWAGSGRSPRRRRSRARRRSGRGRPPPTRACVAGRCRVRSACPRCTTDRAARAALDADAQPSVMSPVGESCRRREDPDRDLEHRARGSDPGRRPGTSGRRRRHEDVRRERAIIHSSVRSMITLRATATYAGQVGERPLHGRPSMPSASGLPAGEELLEHVRLHRGRRTPTTRAREQATALGRDQRRPTSRPRPRPRPRRRRLRRGRGRSGAASPVSRRGSARRPGPRRAPPWSRSGS